MIYVLRETHEVPAPFPMRSSEVKHNLPSRCDKEKPKMLQARGQGVADEGEVRGVG